MKYFKLYSEFVNESIKFQDLYQSKNKWIQLYKRGDIETIKKDLFVIVEDSYGSLEDNKNIENVDELFSNEIYFWEPFVSEINNSHNTVVFGKKSAYGKQIIGIGHDGKKESKKELIEKLIKQLKKPGYWMKTGSTLSEILYKKGAPYLEERSDVEKIFNDIEWLNVNGKYIRKYKDDAERTETIFGRPVF